MVAITPPEFARLEIVSQDSITGEVEVFSVASLESPEDIGTHKEVTEALLHVVAEKLNTLSYAGSESMLYKEN